MDCTNCGHPLEEKYCEACGEKRFDKAQLSIKHYVEETFEGLVHFDNKFFRNLKMLFAKPGQLSLDYVEGRRTRYMKPVQFFVVTNLIFFILMIGNPYSLRLENYIAYKPFTNYNTKNVVNEKTKKLGISISTYGYIFDENMKSESKELIFVFVPIYALICWLLFFLYDRLFVEHLVFATHFVAFVLCWFFILKYLVTFPFYLISKINYSPLYDEIVSILTCVVVGAYMAVAARRFYRSNVVWSLICGLVVGYFFFDIIQVYRMILFFKIVHFG